MTGKDRAPHPLPWENGQRPLVKPEVKHQESTSAEYTRQYELNGDDVVGSSDIHLNLAGGQPLSLQHRKMLALSNVEVTIEAFSKTSCVALASEDACPESKARTCNTKRHHKTQRVDSHT